MRAGYRLKHWGVRLLFAFYMYALLKIILFKFGRVDVAFLWDQLLRTATYPEYIVARLQAGNLVPLKEITRALDALTVHSLTNLFGNIAIFVPFGMFLNVLAKAGKLTLAGTLWRSLAVSIGLESVQVLFSLGTFDVDDLILNSIGGMLGFVAYRLESWLTTPASAVPGAPRAVVLAKKF